MIDQIAEALRAFTDRRDTASPYATEIEGLSILRSDHEKLPSHIISKPALCIVAQGAKWTSFGENRFRYQAGQALIVSVEMPSVGRVTRASPDEPFLGAIMEFDPAVMKAVLGEVDVHLQQKEDFNGGAVVTDLEGPLADAILRLLHLLDSPRAIRTLAPLIQREIYYRLLDGPHGADIARIVVGGDRWMPIVEAIHCLRDRFRESVTVGELAAIARLGPSAFHRRFKQLTSLSPDQYQKQLRLMEARRLMISEGANVETAAFEVGYGSASQFSRECSRMFGVPPKRDATSYVASWSENAINSDS